METMMISLAEYAKKHQKSLTTVRKYASDGKFKSAKKIGRNWVIDENEPYAVKERHKTTKLKLVSLFSGCGGMDLGFLGGFNFLGKNYSRNPVEIIWANELNHAACETYRTNFKKEIIEGDIYKNMDKLPRSADIVIGGFPCQDISINGKMLGVKGKRSSLYTAIIETVKRVKPKIFVAENVGSIFLKKHKETLEKIVSDFKSLGYNLTYHLYHANDYGVPQTRDRVFFIGTQQNILPFQVPKPVCTQAITAKQAIGDLENVPETPGIAHIWSKANPSKDQGSRKLQPDRPGYTIRAECHGNIQFHYSLPRRISMREAARIQSFPDSFIFPSKLRETERQIGNAVPPVLAWYVARSVIKSILN